MEGPGGIIIRGKLEELKEKLDAWFGRINELKAGYDSGEPMPAKPTELVEYELIKETGLFWIAGGLYDQPWLFLQKYDVVKTQHEIFNRLGAKK